MAEPPALPVPNADDAPDSSVVVAVDNADSAMADFGPYASAVPGTPPLGETVYDSDSDAGELAAPGFRPLAASSDSDEENSVVSNPPSSVRGELDALEEANDDADGDAESSSDTAEDNEANDEKAGDAEGEEEEKEAKEDEMDSGAVEFKKRKCAHLKSGVKVTRVKRLLAAKIKKGIACQGCTKEKQPNAPNSLFVCLSCGQINCGRDSLSHAVSHNANTSHPLSIALSPSGQVWCYSCDDEIDAAPGINQVVIECRAMIKEILLSLDKGKTSKGIVISSSRSPTVVMPPKVERAKNRLMAPGLRNLGNTCFFNATLQNLAYSQPLVEAMRPLTETPVASEDAKDPSIYDGALTSSLATLLVSMNNRARGLAAPASKSPISTPSKFSSSSKLSNDDSCDPRPFFGVLSSKFRDYRALAQQDSHEMLRRSMDQMREEQLAKIKEVLAARGEEKPSFIRTFVDDVFGGDLASIVVCDACKNVSWVSEPFYDLSLSVASEKDEGQKLGASPARGFGFGASLFNRLKITDDSDEEKDKEEKKEEEAAGEKPEPPHPLSSDAAHLEHVDLLLRKVSIGTEPKEASELSLERCLEDFMAVEELKGSERIRCESCWKHLHGDWEDKLKEAEATKAKDVEAAKKKEAETAKAVVEVDGSGEAGEDTVDGDATAPEPEGIEVDAEVDGSQSSSEPEDMKMKNMIDSGVFYMPQQKSVLPKKAPTPKKPAAPAEPAKPGPVMRSAKKRYLMLHPLPPVVVFHLKRFQQSGWRATKISKFVSFPEYMDVDGLTITKHDLKVEGETAGPEVSTKLRLIGVVVHGGSLHSGHYTAFVRVPARAKEDETEAIETWAIETWMYASDTHVREATREEALGAEAYLLFYERV